MLVITIDSQKQINLSINEITDEETSENIKLNGDFGDMDTTDVSNDIGTDDLPF